APTILLARVTGANYDLRWAGATHAALLIFALWLLRPFMARLPWKEQAALWCLILAVFCDVEYFSFFNSLYMDAASYVFLLMLVPCYLRLREQPSDANTALFIAVLFLFLTSKLQHSLLAVVVVPFLLVDPAVRRAFSRWVGIAAVAV